MKDLLSQGWNVRALVRRAGSAPAGCEERVGDVRDDAQALAETMRGCSALIHLAAAKSDEAWSDDVNVRGTANVWSAAEKSGVKKAVYMSTQSAKLKKPGVYGRTKLAGERAAGTSPVPTVILRPSLVYGDGDEGVFGTLKSLAKLPVIPVFGPGTALFRPIHVDELARCVRAALETDHAGETFDVGGADALTFDGLILDVLAREGLRRPLFHLPRAFGYALATVPGSPVTKSNVRGGIERVHMNLEPMRAALGIEPKPFRVDTRFERSLLRYVFRGVVPRWNPSDATVSVLTTALRTHGIASTGLPPSWLLGPIDAITRLLWPNGRLQRTLRVAAAVAECQPVGADALLPRRMSPVSVLLSTAMLCLRAALLTTAGMLLGLIFPSYVRRHGT